MEERDRYKKIIDNCNKCMVEMMLKVSDFILERLSRLGYTVVEARERAIGEIKYKDVSYFYRAKTISYPQNPLIPHVDMSEFAEDIDAITKCVPDKDKYIIVMHLPIALDWAAVQPRFTSWFDVVKIKEQEE